MTDPRIIALSSNPGQVEPGPFSEHDLREQWNAQADEFNQWESLDSCEQLAWAQTRAIAADRFLPPVAKPTPVDLAALHDPNFSGGLTPDQHLDVLWGGPDPRVTATPAPEEPETERVLRLAAIIREVDLMPDAKTLVLGDAALAEAILAHPEFSDCHDGPAALPAPDHVNLIGFAFGREPWATWLRQGGCLESAHCELSDLMLAVLAKWGRPAALPAQEARDGHRPELDQVARIVYEGAMRATAPDFAQPHWPEWCDLPSSDARNHALNTAEIILTHVRCAALPAQGEVAELVAVLEADAECIAAEQPDLMQLTDKQLRRIAELLKGTRALPAPGFQIGPQEYIPHA